MATERRASSRTYSVLGVVTLLVLVVFLGSATVATVAPTGCTACHFGDAAFKKATLATAHKDVSCAACHVDGNLVPRAKFALYQTFGMRVRLLDPSSSDVSAVTDRRCLGCHASVEKKTTLTGGIRVRHQKCAQGRTCVSCHSETAHGSAVRWAQVSSMGDCVTCHRAAKASVACDTCHADKDTTERFATSEFAVTHGPNWQKTHGMGRMSTCSVCHQEDKCSRCHGPGVPHQAGFLRTHPQYVQRSGAKCMTCHRQDFCTSCHGLPMPHPKDFAKGHSALVGRDGKQACLRCHEQSDCDTCHVKHIHPGGAVGNIPAPFKKGS